MDDDAFDTLLAGITRDDVRSAADSLRVSPDHKFQNPKFRHVVIGEELHGVRPVIAFAVRRQRQNRQLGLEDFDGGRDTRSASHLKKLGFEIRPLERE